MILTLNSLTLGKTVKPKRDKKRPTYHCSHLAPPHFQGYKLLWKNFFFEILIIHSHVFMADSFTGFFTYLNYFLQM